MPETRPTRNRDAGRRTSGRHAQTHAQPQGHAQAPIQPQAARQAARRSGSGAAVVIRTILISLVTLAAGFALGVLLGPRLPMPQLGHVAPAFPGKATVAESELDAVLGTYTAGGTTTSVTVREALIEEGGLEAAKNADGSYSVPAADTVLAIARDNQLSQ